MLLCCPLCGSESFFVDEGERPTFFGVNEAYEAVDVRPEGAFAPDARTEFNCTSCSWRGTASELKAD